VRDSEEQRLAELEAGYCINRTYDNNECNGAKMGLFLGLSMCIFTTGFSTYFGLALKASSWKCSVFSMLGPFTGVSCLVCTGSAICLCAGKQIVRNRNEREVLQSQLTREPGPANLHGAMFSWQPTVAHQERAPAALRMNE
jgi:heme/copper-type cytochrome/quinol oxidase subunit 3